MTTEKNTSQLNHLEVMEHFFNAYPAEEAQQLLWKWLVKVIKEDSSKLPLEETKAFTEFFQSLEDLILAARELYVNKANKEGAPYA